MRIRYTTVCRKFREVAYTYRHPDHCCRRFERTSLGLGERRTQRRQVAHFSAAAHVAFAVHLHMRIRQGQSCIETAGLGRAVAAAEQINHHRRGAQLARPEW